MDWVLRVLQEFPDLAANVFVAPPLIEPLGNHGGFSGAHLYRILSIDGPLLLKVWPADRSRGEIEAIHSLMEQARHSGLSFVPSVYRTHHGHVLVHDGCCIDLTRWQPGSADFWEHPRPTRMRSAAIALAQLHEAWAGQSPHSTRGGPTGPVLAVHRRFQALSRWKGSYDSVALIGQPEWLLSAHGHVARWFAACMRVLEASQTLSLGRQPCLCDIWHDHVLFEGDEVTGIIDYGSVKVDHVAVDLARMLGSMVEDDLTLWNTGLAAYQEVRPLSRGEQDLTHLLDRTGVIVALANWVRWAVEGKCFSDPAAVSARVSRLIKRVERWSSLLPY